MLYVIESREFSITFPQAAEGLVSLAYLFLSNFRIGELNSSPFNSCCINQWSASIKIPAKMAHWSGLSELLDETLKFKLFLLHRTVVL